MGLKAGIKTAVGMFLGVLARPLLEARALVRTTWEFKCYGPDGELKWVDGFSNLVTTEGKNDLLSKYLKGSAYTAAWYVGLKGAGSAVAGDTAASHAGWSELTAYSESVRQTLTLGAVVAGSVDNSGSPAVFSVNGAMSLSGAFLSSSSTKSGTDGVLYAAGDFASARTLASGDVVSVTCTATAA